MSEIEDLELDDLSLKEMDSTCGVCRQCCKQEISEQIKSSLGKIAYVAQKNIPKKANPSNDEGSIFAVNPFDAKALTNDLKTRCTIYQNFPYTFSQLAQIAAGKKSPEQNSIYGITRTGNLHTEKAQGITLPNDSFSSIFNIPRQKTPSCSNKGNKLDTLTETQKAERLAQVEDFDTLTETQKAEKLAQVEDFDTLTLIEKERTVAKGEKSENPVKVLLEFFGQYEKEIHRKAGIESDKSEKAFADLEAIQKIWVEIKLDELDETLDLSDEEQWGDSLRVLEAHGLIENKQKIFSKSECKKLHNQMSVKMKTLPQQATEAATFAGRYLDDANRLLKTLQEMINNDTAATRLMIQNQKPH